MNIYRSTNWKSALRSGIAGCFIGFLYSFAEHYWKGTLLAPLMIRAIIAGFTILFSIAWFEIWMRDLSRKMNFMMMLLVKSVAYLVIIIFLLMLVNGINQVIASHHSLFREIKGYIYGDMFLSNILTLISAILLTNVIIMINSLHRPGELISFVLGRYHQPREVERIFLFIDLNDSTTIAERIGNHMFGKLLQAIYLDVSAAVRLTGGVVSDYIGDEVVISWKMAKGLHSQQCVKCFFLLEEIIHNHRDFFVLNFGTIPQFKAGMHSGSVVVMWVGNERKEIVYLGDVLNTAKRIQTECSRLDKKFLISGSLLDMMDGNLKLKTQYFGKSQLKGKLSTVEIYSVDALL